MYTAPQAGQTGYHRRTQYNNRILLIGGEELNLKGGFPHYGLIKSECVVVKGSIPGPAKRFVFLRKAIRAHPPVVKPQILWIE